MDCNQSRAGQYSIKKKPNIYNLVYACICSEKAFCFLSTAIVVKSIKIFLMQETKYSKMHQYNSTY